MKIPLIVLAIAVFATAGCLGMGKGPAWRPEHVTQISFGEGQLGSRQPPRPAGTVTDRIEIDRILSAFRRAEKRMAPQPDWNSYNAAIGITGERPERGSWLLNLDTGDCTKVDPLTKPVYRFTEEDRRMLRGYFNNNKTEADTSGRTATN